MPQSYILLWGIQGLESLKVQKPGHRIQSGNP